MPILKRQVVETVINGEIEQHDKLEHALGYWVGSTHLDPAAGGIQVKQYELNTSTGVEVCVRKAWLVHVKENGVVYLNSTLRAEGVS